MSNEEEVGTDNQQGGAPAPAAAGGDNAAERLAALQSERDELKDRMLRIAAEFENWKRRARKEQEDAEAKVKESVLKDMLDVIDNLERAVGAYGAGAAEKDKGKDKGAAKGAPAAPKVDAAEVLKGVGLVLRLFQSKLERYGVKPIVAEGQPFDPRLHEAISKVESATIPPGNVAAEMQRGYRLGERLLRPSMVSVATAPANAGPGNGKGEGKGTGTGTGMTGGRVTDGAEDDGA